jgi:Fe-S-cluster-containing dehydrogenase component
MSSTVFVVTESCLGICANPKIPREFFKHPICIDVCPVNGIKTVEGEDQMYFIDPTLCIGCKACWYECPVEAIYAKEDVPEAWKEYIELNALWHAGEKETVRKRIAEISPLK